MILKMVIAIVLVYLVLYVVLDSAQQYLYDQVAEGLWWRTLVSALPLGALLAVLPMRLDEAVLTGMHWVVLQIAAWFLAFWLLCKCNRGHALALGAVCFGISAPLITLAIDSMLQFFVATPT